MGRPGRNDACHCGSGRKYKRCCLADDREKGHAKGGSPHARPGGSSSLPTRTLEVGGLPHGKKLEGQLADRRDDVLSVLSDRGVVPLAFRLQDRLRVLFEERSCKRWQDRASEKVQLVEAREAIHSTIEEGTFEHRGGQRAHKERREAVADPIGTLTAGGDEGLAHLGVLLHTESWASSLALEAAVEASPGPRRDRLIVEGLFLPGDFVPDLAIRNVDAIRPEDRLEAITAVAGEAAASEVELQGGFWTGLFELDPGTLEEPIRPRVDYGPALEVLYQRGHFGALARGVTSVLDPTFDSPESVEAFLDDTGFQRAIEHIRSTSPPDRLAAEASFPPE